MNREDPPTLGELRALILGEKCTYCGRDYAYCLALEPDACCSDCDHTGQP